MGFDLETVKEPRGFMKILQFFFAILAFSTTTSFSTQFSFHVTLNSSINCTTAGATMVNHTAYYPFRLDHESEVVQLCKEPAIISPFRYVSDTSSDARFFVAMGVVCMLVSVGALVYYSAKGDEYQMSRAPTLDFGLHIGLTVLLLAAACAWSDGARTLKVATDPSVVSADVCRHLTNVTCHFDPTSDISGSYGKLNISLIFGFLNVFLWGSNLWFIYKETSWFSRIPDSGAEPVGNI